MNRWPLALGIGVTLFYLCFHSAYYNFDGVACAIAVDLADLRHLAHGNHLLFGLLGWAWAQSWRLLGFRGPSLVPLQTLDSLLGGLGAGLFCRFLLRRLRLSPPVALGAAAALALSYAWWFWSLEAQVYLLGAVFLLLASDAAWAEEPRPWGTGFFHGLAILGHVGHAMFLFPAVFLLRREGHTRCLWLRYAAALALTVVSAYAVVALWFVRPRDLLEWKLWLLGSAALGRERAFSWYWPRSLSQGLCQWLAMTLRIFAEPDGLPRPWATLGWLLAGLPMAAAAARLQRWSRTERACALWLLGYGLLYLTWQPSTMVYRISDLIVLWLLAALFAQELRWRSWTLGACALGLGLFNGVLQIGPQTDPRGNGAYQEALQVARVTPAEAWIVVQARGQVYVPYFAQRRPLNLRYFEGRPQALELRLQELRAQGDPVFISDSLLRDSVWQGFFSRYALERVGGPESPIYRIGTNGKPSGSRQKKLNAAPAARNGPNGTGSSMRRSPRSTRPIP